MHLIMILTAVGLACWLRGNWYQASGNWTQRWQRALLFFLLPPLLLIMTALAVLCMGPQGKMMGLHTDWLSYCLIVAWVVLVVVFGLRLALEASESVQRIRSYHQIDLDGIPARLLEHPMLFIAQIGLWQPELVISQGLLQELKPPHLEAVLAHEQAHLYYRDTFWFFWLGWLRRLSSWLPNTEALWQELLILREIRADRWAAERVDALVLAESLLTVVSAPMIGSKSFCAAFSRQAPANRLQERIDALLEEPDLSTASSSWAWSWVILGLLPLVTVPFHS
ncbi:M48 family metalloprotease [Lyngbya aestuarii]|uniref:M48 family metalloprotease n=1 Tax=Lyngbya aestuarii TaxID=118322 RepID=UPI00403DB2F1